MKLGLSWNFFSVKIHSFSGTKFDKCLQKAKDKKSDPYCIKTEKGDLITVANKETYECYQWYKKGVLENRGKCKEGMVFCL